MFYNKDIDLTEVFKDDINKFVGECQSEDVDDIADVYEVICMFLDYISEQIMEETEMILNDFLDERSDMVNEKTISQIGKEIEAVRNTITLDVIDTYKKGDL